MQIDVQPGDALAPTTDLVVVGVFADEIDKNPSVKLLDRVLNGELLAVARDEDFKGRPEQRVVLLTFGKLKARRVALVGLGRRKAFGPLQAVNFGGTVVRLGNQHGAKHVVAVLPKDLEVDGDLIGLLARGAYLGDYRYDRFLSERGRAATLARLTFNLGTKKAPASAKKSIARAAVLADAVAAARDLVNEPPIELYPESFAKLAQSMAKKHGLGVKVYDAEQLAKMNMNLLLAVGMGSAHEPRLVHLTYTPKGGAKGQPIVLVGKGITFDSGGLCLKGPEFMMDMKVDMGGAAAVFAAMRAIAELAPKIEVHGILALAENMPSGTAFRLGDVIRSAAGRTVEINNTDAEGRLVLADAIHYAKGLKPRRLVDLATLTGACVVALGPYTVGLLSNHDGWAADLLAAAERAGEDVWRLPLNPALKEQLKSDVADTKNTGERYGGAITAGLFLSEFVGDVPWCHMDIAGPVTSKKDAGAFSKGGTGVGVATLVELIAG